MGLENEKGADAAPLRSCLPDDCSASWGFGEGIFWGMTEILQSAGEKADPSLRS
jgi:hypothetical protein